MSTIATWLNMGGYARFVWPAYGVTALAMIVLMIVAVRSLRGKEETLRGQGGPRRDLRR